MKYYEEEVISVPASWGADGIVKYGVYSCPLQRKYNYRPSLYIAFRAEGGGSKCLYKLRACYELLPNVQMIANRDMDLKDRTAIVKYLSDPKYEKVASANCTTQFFVLDMKHVIKLPKGGVHASGRSPRGIAYYYLADMLDSKKCKILRPARSYK